MTSGPARFGLSCAIVTPRDRMGSPDLPRLVDHAAGLLRRGCDTITLFGTTGEGSQLGLDAKRTMLGALLGARVDGDQLYCCVLSNAIPDAVQEGRFALQAGVRGLLVAPPHYFKGVSDEGLFAWYSAVIEGLGALARGIVLYHIPQLTMAGLSVDLIGRLKRAFPGVIIGVKDSAGRWENTEALLAQHGDLAILVGDERDLARAVRLGGQGSICGLANLVPELVRPMVHGGEEQPRVNALVDAVLACPVVPAIKALLARQRGDEAFASAFAPLESLDAARRGRLFAAWDNLFGS